VRSQKREFKKTGLLQSFSLLWRRKHIFLVRKIA